MTTAVSQQVMPLNAADAIWALIQTQKKSVQKDLAKRFATLAKEERHHKKKAEFEANPELLAEIEQARQEIREGKCTVCRTQEELDAFFDSL